MAGDSPDSRRKNRHSPAAAESLDRSKRRKHRHHHRHHRRSHHRHNSGSRDHDDERRADVEAINGDESVRGVEEVKETARSANTKDDYDMEEGEIVEGENSIGGAEFGANRAMSDSESGEVRVFGAPSRVDDSNSRIMDNDGIFGPNDEKSVVNNSGEPIGELKPLGNGGRNENNADEDVDYPSNKGNKGDATLHQRSHSPARGKNEHKGLNGAEVEEGDKSDRYSKVSQSPPHGRYHDEASRRSRSKSPNYLRRKSHSQSIFAEEYSRRGHGHVRHDNDRAEYMLDDERTRLSSRDNRHRDRDLVKGKDRERRRALEEDNHHDRESWDKESREKYGDRKAGKERQIRDRDRDREPKKEREHDKKGEKLQERSRDVHGGEYDESRYREKDRQYSKERDLEAEHRRGSSRSSYKDSDMEREQEKDRERYRDKFRDVSRRLRDNGSERHRDKARNAENDRISRHYRRDDEDRYDDRGRSYDSKHRIDDSEDYHRDRKRIHDSEKDRVSRDDSLKESENKGNRDQDDPDDYPENMELELVQQEEEDINRIKEESKRRREAILQKYRNQELQQKVKPQLDTAGKAHNKEISGQSSRVLVDGHALQEKTDDKGDQAFSVTKSPSQNEASMVEKSSGAGGLGEGSPKSERSNDMFNIDIFGDSPAGGHKMGKGDGLLVDRSGLHDNWDDPEGYYGYRLGEILDNRYEVTAAHGKGVFSTVVRAKDLKAGDGDPEEVAIKIIRSNDTMLKAGMEELVILKKLVGADPDDRRHCVLYISNFKYHNHLCLVFESLHMNLREVLKKFGRNIGLKLTAVRAYSKQLFIALKHLKNCGVLHCDIKPDNMLVNEAKNVLKLCDFGNAMFAGKNEVTPYLVSRFYRAPEIILGLAYDHPLDMWSVGCCLYELYTGKVLFPGSTNNDMLRLHMELKGPFPKKMLRKGAFTDQHFDQDLNFLAIEEDVVTKKSIRRLIFNIKPKDIGTIIKGSPGEDPKMLANFKDLLDKIFVLDPDKRPTVSQALNHPFITGK